LNQLGFALIQMTWMTFIAAKILAGLPIIMLRFGVMSKMFFIKFCFKEKIITQRELDEVYKQNQTIFYGWEVSRSHQRNVNFQ